MARLAPSRPAACDCVTFASIDALPQVAAAASHHQRSTRRCSCPSHELAPWHVESCCDASACSANSLFVDGLPERRPSLLPCRRLPSVAGCRRAGRDQIEADVYVGTRDDDDALALGANRTHGQRLNRAPTATCHRACVRYLAGPEPGRIARQVPARSAVPRVIAGSVCRCSLDTCLSRVVGEDGKSYSRTWWHMRSAGFLPSPVRTDFGPSRLRSLTWIRCWNLPFLLLPVPRLVGSAASRCRSRRSTASHRLRPDRPSLRCTVEPSVPGLLYPGRVGGRARCAESPCAGGSD